MENIQLTYTNNELPIRIDFNNYNTFDDRFKNNYRGILEDSIEDSKTYKQQPLKHVYIEQQKENNKIHTNGLQSSKYALIISIPFIILNICSFAMALQYQKITCIPNDIYRILPMPLSSWLIIGANFSSFNILMTILDSYYDYNCVLGYNKTTKYSTWGIIQIINDIVLRLIFIPLILSVIIYELTITYEYCKDELMPLCIITIIFLIVEILRCIYNILKYIMCKCFMAFLDGIES
jgi:hypothetical protein